MAALLLALQGLVGFAAGIWLEVGTAVERPRYLGLGLSSGFLLLACGAAVVVVAWFLAKARPWTRGPAVVAELLALLMGYDVVSASSVLSGVSTAIGWVVIAVSLATLIVMVLPASTAVFRDRSL